MEQIAQAFDLIVKLHEALGLPSMKEMGTPWHYRVDDQWEFTVNGSGETVEMIPPYTAALTFNGWPAGLLNPYGGVMAAGTVANEDALIAALKQAIQRVSVGTVVTP